MQQLSIDKVIFRTVRFQSQWKPT